MQSQIINFSLSMTLLIKLNVVSWSLTSSLSDDVLRTQPGETSLHMVTVPRLASCSPGQFGSSPAGCNTQPPVLHTGSEVKPTLECIPN